MRRFAIPLLALAWCASSALAQEPAEPLSPISFLAGEFSGEGKHPYGTYQETIEAKWTLGGTVLELRSKSVLQGQTVFEDLRVFSWDAGTKALRLRQWTPGLLREYTGKAGEGGDVIFEETSREGASAESWRYTFTPGKPDGFSYRVDTKKGGKWKPYVSGTLSGSLKDPGTGGGMGVREYEATIDGMKAQIHHPDGKGPFPTIVFSPGGNANTFQGYRPYGRWYATWGYVTVIVAFDDPSAKERAPKFSKVVHWLVKENARDGSPLKGMIDTTRLAAAGHSRGGNAALRAARSDYRFKACLAFAPSGPTEAVEGKGTARICIFGAGDDSLLDAGKKAYEVMPGERVLIIIAGMNHMLAPREATLRLVARSTAFLNSALKGDERYRSHLLAESEGLTITSTER